MYDYLDSVINLSWMYMHDRKRDLLWQTRIITEVYFFVVLDVSSPHDACQRRKIKRNRRCTLQKNTLPWWYVFVTVGHVFCHACTSMTNLWRNQDSHTCPVVEVFHAITKIIIMEVSTSMTINRASQKWFRQGWPTRGIHRNGTQLSYRVGFWIR